MNGTNMYYILISCRFRYNGDGWQSSPNCAYPQHLIIQLNSFQNERHRVRLQSIKILCHEYMIPTKIEIHIASDAERPSNKNSGYTFDSCRNIKRLGYVKMDSNERSRYQARERKSIAIDDEIIDFIKLTLHDCYHNELNSKNQVGIAALTILGTIEESKDTDKSEIICDTSLPIISKNNIEQRNIILLHNDPISPYDKRQTQISTFFHIDDQLKKRLENLERLKQQLASEEVCTFLHNVSFCESDNLSLFFKLLFSNINLNLSVYLCVSFFLFYFKNK